MEQQKVAMMTLDAIHKKTEALEANQTPGQAHHMAKNSRSQTQAQGVQQQWQLWAPRLPTRRETGRGKSAVCIDLPDDLIIQILRLNSYNNLLPQSVYYN